MKIFILTTRGDSIGGAQIHIKDIAKRLQDEGHDVIVAFGEEGAFSNLLENLDIPYIIIDSLVRQISPLNDLKALRNIISEIKHMQPDLIATHSSKAGILGRVAAKLTKTPVIFTAHGWAFTEGVTPKKRVLYKWIEKLGAFLADHIITVSYYDKALALKNNVCFKDKITAIQNGMNDIDKILLSQPTISPPTIMMVARFQEPKDHISLINALYQLKHMSWNLQLVGEDGGLMQEAKDLVTELGMNERVDFLGNRSDIEELLSKSQIFVLTSFWEGFPLTIIEAMRAGLPIVASNVGGISEAVRDGETGYVVTDFKMLVTRLEILIGSSVKRVALGKTGRERYKNNFTFEHMYTKTYAIYEKVIANSHKR